SCSRDPRYLPSFPTRRSSDLPFAAAPPATTDGTGVESVVPVAPVGPAVVPPSLEGIEYADIAGLAEKAAQGATSRDMVAYLLKRSEEHTSELQSRRDLVCRLL